MAKNVLPPGPNPRGDQMTEKDQEQLRRAKRRGGEGVDEEEFEPADPAEGERSGAPAFKMRHTPGQAEGDRETIEEEEKRH